MSDEARSVTEAVERLNRHDTSLKWIALIGKQHTDAELSVLLDCLLAHPNFVTHVFFDRNQLTDETGVKLAQYLAASSTLRSLDLECNQFGSATYLALAAALRVNSSLGYLYLIDNQAVDQARIDAALIDALRLNPERPGVSMWSLYSDSNEFLRLQDAAEQLGHPSLQSLLVLLC